MIFQGKRMFWNASHFPNVIFSKINFALTAWLIPCEHFNSHNTMLDFIEGWHIFRWVGNLKVSQFLLCGRKDGGGKLELVNWRGYCKLNSIEKKSAV